MWREQYNNIKRSNQFDSAVERGTSWHCILWCCAAGFWWSMSYNMLLIPSSLSMMEPVGCALVTFGAEERWCITFDFLKGSGAVCVPSNIGDAQTRRGVSVLGFNSTSGYDHVKIVALVSKFVCCLKWSCMECLLLEAYLLPLLLIANIISCENLISDLVPVAQNANYKFYWNVVDAAGASESWYTACSCTVHVPVKLIVSLLY